MDGSGRSGCGNSAAWLKERSRTFRPLLQGTWDALEERLGVPELLVVGEPGPVFWRL